MENWKEIVCNQLHGPIVVLGASGFVGANLLRYLLSFRDDVIGTYNDPHPWRLDGINPKNLFQVNLLLSGDVERLLNKHKPQTVFDCVAYGGYSFQNDADLIYRSNFLSKVRLMELLELHKVQRYIHAGSSSEYGREAAGPDESAQLTPNSHYAVSKAGVSGLIHYFGKCRGFACANLRLYSVYGPYEDSSRLIPAVVFKGLKRELPEFVDPRISRDFVYVDDVSRAFVLAAVNLTEDLFGDSFNIGSGEQTTIKQVADFARRHFDIAEEPKFTMTQRSWDISNWFSNPEHSEQKLKWKATTSFEQGISTYVEWVRALPDLEKYRASSKKFSNTVERSVSAIIACYKDEQAIPIMYERLTKVFLELGIEYEIIFVNDNSPDQSEEVIRRISETDTRVIGISHSRNFGSQSAFRSGMDIASKNSVVLLDGDLQDPPELITDFVAKWKEGFEVIYGVRTKREMPVHLALCYKLFYRIFEKFSYIPIPRDAGDFSLIERRVVEHILSFPERDFLLRGVRAFAGFKHTGVSYYRPERMFGRSTNNIFKNIGWAKKGLLAYSNTPLNFLTTSGIFLFLIVCFFIALQIVLRIIFPDAAPRGITTILIVVAFFGAFNLLAISILGEYLGKVLEEVKRRPHYIRRNIIRSGKLQEVASSSQQASVKNV